jgi:hypothetical protein
LGPNNPAAVGWLAAPDPQCPDLFHQHENWRACLYGRLTAGVNDPGAAGYADFTYHRCAGASLMF